MHIGRKIPRDFKYGYAAELARLRVISTRPMPWFTTLLMIRSAPQVFAVSPGWRFVRGNAR